MAPYYSIVCSTSATTDTFENSFEDDDKKTDIWNALMVQAATKGYIDSNCKWDKEPA